MLKVLKLRMTYGWLRFARAKGFISEELFRNRVNRLHFIDRNDHYFQMSYGGQWLEYLFQDPKWQISSRTTNLAKREGFERRFLLGLSALVLVGLLLVLMGVWKGSPAPWENVGEKPRVDLHKIEGPAVSKTPAYEAELYPGLRIKAPEGSLKPNTHPTAHALSLKEAFSASKGSGIILPVVGAFEFSGGLKKGESFEKPVVIEVDLSKTIVPPSLREKIVVYRIGDDGKAERVWTERVGNRLLIHTSKNSIFEMCVAFVIGMGALIAYIDSGSKYGDETYIAYGIPDKDYSLYTIYWPIKHKYNQPRDPSKLASIRQDIEEVVRGAHLKWSQGERRFVPVSGSITDEQSYYYALSDVQHKDAYKRLEKEMKDFEFLKKYYYPEKVTVVIEALVQSHKYLFDTRGFNRLTNGVDIVLRDPWPADFGSAAGLSDDPYTKHPYIAVNLSALSTQSQVEAELVELKNQGRSAAAINAQRPRKEDKARESQDDLLCTVVHELFHVDQFTYKSNWYNNDLHFCEATAALLEDEAVEHFKKLQLFKDPNYKTQPYDDYQLLETAWGEDTDDKGKSGKSVAINHGYVFSHVLKYLRDSSPVWSKRSKDDFLKALMDEYAGKEPRPSLFNMSYHHMLQGYTMKEAAIILSKLKVERFDKGRNLITLSSVKNEALLASGDYQPYSIKGYSVTATAAGQESVLLISPRFKTQNRPDYLGITLASGTLAPAMKTAEVPVAYAIYPAPVQNSYMLVSEELTYWSNAEKPAKDAYGIDLAIAEKPAPPVVKYDEKKQQFKLTFKKSRLEKNRLYKGRMIKVRPVGASAPTYETFMRPETNEITLPLETLMNDSNDKVSLLERLVAKGLHYAFRSAIAMAGSVKSKDVVIIGSGDSYTFKIAPDPEKKAQTSESDAGDKQYLKDTLFLTLGSQDGIFKMQLKTDMGYYLNTDFSAIRIIEYLKYVSRTIPGFQFKPEFAKEFNKYEKGFELSFHEVYSIELLSEVRDAPSYKTVMEQPVPSVSGPEGDQVELKPARTELSNLLPPGLYTGDLFIGIKTNMADEAVASSVSAEVAGNLQVVISLSGQKIYGKLMPTTTPGRFKFYQKVKRGNTVTYEPVENAYASISQDGVLVFSFIPAVLRR